MVEWKSVVHVTMCKYLYMCTCKALESPSENTVIIISVTFHL